jgi:succinate dehydrogenase / fumarate reductase cytochrome b subunit
MSVSAVINPKGPSRPRPGATALAWADAYLTSTVGQKIAVALTGLGLTAFALFHMAGNLKMLPGGPPAREAMNGYAYFLKHELGVWLWVARGGLLALFLVHLYIAVRLKLRSVAARPVGYSYQRAAQASAASTTMIWTGAVVGAFVLFHLAHYTFGWVHDVPRDGGGWTNYLDLKDETGRHDVYNMVIAGFTTPWISAIYLVCQVLFFVHLSHGIPSTFQTLGLKSRRFAAAIRAAGVALAAVIVAGNVLIVAAVWGGWVKAVGP